jgi:hypothetical protein
VCFNGHVTTFAWIVPRTTTGSDWRGRMRQWGVDRSYAHPGRGGEWPLLTLERLEEGAERRAVGTE